MGDVSRFSEQEQVGSAEVAGTPMLPFLVLVLTLKGC